MGELIKPSRVSIITKEGEYQLHIIVDLNINLNTGDLKADKPNREQEDDDKTIWAIPTFKSQDKVKFGKKE